MILKRTAAEILGTTNPLQTSGKACREVSLLKFKKKGFELQHGNKYGHFLWAQKNKKGRE